VYWIRFLGSSCPEFANFAATWVCCPDSKNFGRVHSIYRKPI
jgi:hypothetical protein